MGRATPNVHPAVRAGEVRLGTRAGRWVVAATALGSGVAFLDSTVVNTALPAIGRDFADARTGVGAAGAAGAAGAGLAGLQWVLTGYLLSLGALLVLGGALGDRYGRRRLFVIGVWMFAVSSALCGAAPTLGVLVGGRIVQGVGAAALVPASLAIISAVVHPDDRARAIGAWTGLTGVASAIGPFAGGWLIDHLSWRWVFLVNLPLSAAAALFAGRHVPETRDPGAAGRIDAGGATLLSAGLAGVVYALIEGPVHGWAGPAGLAAVVGAGALVGFAVLELRIAHPMVPPAIFRSRQFVGGNVVTFVVWGAMGAVFFLVTVQLQQNLGYSALEAGAALLPITVLMLAFSARSGEWARRHGARAPMAVGALMVAAGFALYTRIGPGAHYLPDVFPGVLAQGIGLVVLVSPLTAAVLAAVDEDRVGLGSAVNNAVARIASLLAIATLPALAGIDDTGPALARGFRTAMVVSAFLAIGGSLVAAGTIRDQRRP